MADKDTPPPQSLKKLGTFTQPKPVPIGTPTRIGPDHRAPAREGLAGWLNWLASFAVPIYPEQEVGPVDLLAAVPPLRALKAFATGAKAADTVGDTAKGIRAYHGSPHDFDRFALEKIGTGEGAQAYGHGLYFAEGEDVAKSYRDALASGEALTVRLPGQKPLQLDAIDDIGLDAAKFLEVGARDAGQFPHNRVYYALKAADRAAEGLPGAAARHTRVKERIQQWGEAQIGYEPIKGKMYEVNIKADPEAFLDWDAPLKDQPEILAAIRKTVPEWGLKDFDYNVKHRITGANAYIN